MKIAVICVGNDMMMDDGVGPQVYEIIKRDYRLPSEVTLECAGVMSMNMINYVNEYDLIITVDAVDGTDEKPGTVFRYAPDDIARRGTPMASLHDLKLADLFDAAGLLGFKAEGLCLGMQVENASPSQLIKGLTPQVEAAIPLLVETLVAELTHRGFAPIKKGE